MRKNLKKLATIFLAVAMIFSIAVPAFAANDSYSDTTYGYRTNEYEFGKISHPNNATSTPDGLVDYMGNGNVAVSGSVAGADEQGDRGQSYSWSAMAYGDYVYVGTCYAAMGQTLTAMDSIMGHDFDEEVMRAELNAIFNGTFFYGQEDGVDSKSILVKVNVHTGEMKLIMSLSLNNIAPQFRNAIAYNDKLYFCGSVVANGRPGLPSIYEIDPKDDSFKCVYEGLSDMNEYMQAYQKGVCTGIRGMAVYDGKLVVSNVGVDGGYILISDNPSEGFTKIATQSDLYNYPAIRYVDSVYGGGIWEIVEYNGSLYVAMCSGTPETRVGDNMRSFAIIRGDCSGDWNDPDAWKWTPVVGDKNDGALYTFGIDPARTRAAACNMCIYDGYLYIGEYNDEEIPLEELIFDQDFGFLARNLEQSVNLYRMSIGSDGKEKMELVMGEPTEMFPNGGILCKESGFGDYENQYIWQSKVFDGKLFIGTFDTSSLLEPLGQFTNGDLLKMSRDEWASQLNYLKVMLQLIIKNKTEKLMPYAANTLVEQAADEEDAALTSEQKDELSASITDGSIDAGYSTGVIATMRQINKYLGELKDVVETNDIEGFVNTYEMAINLYEKISAKLPDSIKNAYEKLINIVQLDNMKDLVTCLKTLSTAERGFGLYTIESNDGKLSLKTITRDGFGDPFNHGLRTFAANDSQGWMVIGTANPFMGTQLWRTTIDVPDADPDMPFTDISDCIQDYQDAILWAYNNDITKGTTDTTFSPNQVCTRAQTVTFLWRAMGCPKASNTSNPFTDVSEGSFYYDAVLWAVENGITLGTTATTFSPNDTVTRGQVVTFLYRAEGSPAVSGSCDFTDVQQGTYCYDAVIWAVENGVTKGKTSTTFAPASGCTRAQIVTFLYRDLAE